MKLSPARRVAALLTVCALSLAIHSFGIRAPLLDYHYHRQVNTAAIARNYWRENRPLLIPRIDWDGPEDRLAGTEFPIEMWLHGKLWPLFGLGESWGRILSVAASALTAVFLFLLLEREFGGVSAFFGASLFTMLPIEVYFGRTVQPEAAALLFLVTALYFWELALEPGRSWAAWLAATACAFLSIGLKLPYAHVLIPLAALSWRRLGRAALTDARGWLSVALACGGVFSWYAYASHGVYVVPTHAGEFTQILGYARTPYFIKFLLVSRFPELIATYGGLVFFFFGAREILARRRDIFWLAWIGGAFLQLIALGAYGHIHEYTSLTLAVGVAGLMGEGLRILVERAQAAAPARRAWAAAGIVLLVVSVPVHAALRVGHWYRQGFTYLARAHEAAAAVSGQDDLFFTNSMAPSLVLYVIDRRGWSEEFSTYTGDLPKLIEQRARDGARFVASEKTGLFAEPDGALWRSFRAKSAPLWDDGAFVIFPLKPTESSTARR